MRPLSVDFAPVDSFAEEEEALAQRERAQRGFGSWPRTRVCGTGMAVALLLLGAVVSALSLSGATASALEPPSAAGGRVVALDWTVTAGEAWPTTAAAAAVLLLNGEWEGPTLDVTEGDTLRLTLRNAQPQPLALHFHGLHQRGTPRADGAARANTAALALGEARTFSFAASPAGVHFYHAHAGLTAVQGLHGVVIVRPRAAAAAPLPEAPPLLFSDYWRTPLPALRAGLLARAPAGNFSWVGNPSALLVNYNDASPGANATLALPPGRTLALRLVNGGALSFLNVAIDGHNVTVIEADGAPVAPFATSAVDLNAGERLTLLLTPSDAARAAGVLWLSVATRHRAGGPTGLVALRLPPHDASDDALPRALPLPPSVRPLACQPAWNDTAATLAFYRRMEAPADAPPPPAAQPEPPRVLLGTQNRVRGLMRWSVNNVSFVYPGDPLAAALLRADAAQSALLLPEQNDDGTMLSSGAAALTMLDVAAAAAAGDAGARAAAATWVFPLAAETVRSNNANASSRFARSVEATLGTHVLPLRFNQTIDLVLQNAAALNGVEEQHPWHLHGHSFFVIAYGLGDWPGAAAAATSASASPPRKDTVTLPPGGWVWLRLRADNAGAWPLHCHISWHQYMGMLLVLLVAPELVAPP